MLLQLGILSCQGHGSTLSCHGCLQGGRKCVRILLTESERPFSFANVITYKESVTLSRLLQGMLSIWTGIGTTSVGHEFHHVLVFLIIIMRSEMQTAPRNRIQYEQKSWGWVCSALQVWICVVPDVKSSY